MTEELRCSTHLGHCFPAHTRPALHSFVQRRLCHFYSPLGFVASPQPGPCSGSSSCKTSVPFRVPSAVNCALLLHCLATSLLLLKRQRVCCYFRG